MNAISRTRLGSGLPHFRDLSSMYEVVLLSPAFSDCVLYHQTKGNAEPEDYLTVTIYNALSVHTSYCRIYVGAR